jgi:hypothetical protein
MEIMLYLNLWKLHAEYSFKFRTFEFLDRGMRLFLNKKYGINIYYEKDHNKRLRDESDFYVLDHYFRSESEMSCQYNLEFMDVKKLLSNENIIVDIKEIIKANDYPEKLFNNYDEFVKGFVRFLSRRRLAGDTSKHEFSTYLCFLKRDKFYNKLQKMSWTDSTRKNVYKFFKAIEQELNKKK